MACQNRLSTKAPSNTTTPDMIPSALIGWSSTGKNHTTSFRSLSKEKSALKAANETKVKAAYAEVNSVEATIIPRIAVPSELLGTRKVKTANKKLVQNSICFERSFLTDAHNPGSLGLLTRMEPNPI